MIGCTWQRDGLTRRYIFRKRSISEGVESCPSKEKSIQEACSKLAPSKAFTMQRNLAAAVLLAILCSDICVCRRMGGSTSRRLKKTSTTAATTKLPPTTTASPVQGNLCHGGRMINDVGLEPNDQDFYKAHLKHFPDGLHYPNCSMPLQPNTTREMLVEECVNFTIASSKLNLPKRREASEPMEKVMWLLINHLCANESCGLPCPLSSNSRGLHYINQVLIVALVGWSLLSTK